MELTQAYTDATGTKHEAAYFVPISALYNYRNNSVILNYQVYASQEAFELGLQPVSTSVRPGQGRSGEQAQAEVSTSNRVILTAEKHATEVEQLKQSIQDCCQSQAGSEFTAMVANVDSQLSGLRAKRALKE